MEVRERNKGLLEQNKEQLERNKELLRQRLEQADAIVIGAGSGPDLRRQAV